MRPSKTSDRAFVSFILFYNTNSSITYIKRMNGYIEHGRNSWGVTSILRTFWHGNSISTKSFIMFGSELFGKNHFELNRFGKSSFLLSTYFDDKASTLLNLFFTRERTYPERC